MLWLRDRARSKHGRTAKMKTRDMCWKEPSFVLRRKGRAEAGYNGEYSFERLGCLGS
jgi:hypothetical protein